MQFKIPQNVQREDTIIGPVTMRQLIICGIGGGIAYSIYIALAKSYFWEVWIIPVGIVAALTAATAFLKIHDIPFYKFLLLFLEYMLLPKKRMWCKGEGDVFVSMLVPAQVKTHKDKKTENKEMADMEKMRNLNEISKILNTHGHVSGPNKA